MPGYRKRKYSRTKRKYGSKRRRLQSKGNRLGTVAKTVYSGAKYYYQKAKEYDRMRKAQAQGNRTAFNFPKSQQVLQDYRRVGVRFGRKISAAKRARKLTRQNVNTTILSLRDYGSWGRAYGNVTIGSYQVGIAGTELTCPVHLWDVTTLPQGRSTATSVGASFYELRFTSENSNANPAWYTSVGGNIVPVNDIQMASTTFAKERNLYPTYQSNTSDITIPNHSGGKDSFLEKINAQLVLFGPRTKSVKWAIQLVQFSDEVTPGVGTGIYDSQVARNFWQAMAKPYGYSPIETGPRMELRKHYKVLKSYYCNLDSPESTEDHLQSRVQHVDFRAHLNRKCNYRWNWIGDGVNMSTDDIPEDSALPTVFSTHVHPKARVYIMIRALCQQRPAEDWDSLYFPSYDIKLDTYHKSLD